MTTDKNTNPVDDSLLEDPRASFLIRRALLEDQTEDDSRRAFQRFKELNGLSQHKRRQYAISVCIAAAACIAALFVVTFWHRDDFSTPEQRSAVLLGNVVYEAQPNRQCISIHLGDKDIPLGNANNADGIMVGEKGEIQLFNVPADNHDVVTISVPQGQTAKVMLDDSTSIMLNADSRISFPRHFYEQGPREVALQGEAMFNVTHIEDRPFTVTCKGFKTTVLGTKFNIHAYGGETPQVTLLEGRIAVSNDTQQAFLEPEQAAVVGSNNRLSIADADLEVVNGWTNGMFYYDGQTLHEILAEIGRWYNINVVFASNTHINEQLHLNADRNMPIKEMVKQLKMICTANIKLTDKALIVE